MEDGRSSHRPSPLSCQVVHSSPSDPVTAGALEGPSPLWHRTLSAPGTKRLSGKSLSRSLSGKSGHRDGVPKKSLMTLAV